MIDFWFEFQQEYFTLKETRNTKTNTEIYRNIMFQINLKAIQRRIFFSKYNEKVNIDMYKVYAMQ